MKKHALYKLADFSLMQDNTGVVLAKCVHSEAYAKNIRAKYEEESRKNLRMNVQPDLGA